MPITRQPKTRFPCNITLTKHERRAGERMARQAKPQALSLSEFIGKLILDQDDLQTQSSLIVRKLKSN